MRLWTTRVLLYEKLSGEIPYKGIGRNVKYSIQQNVFVQKK